MADEGGGSVSKVKKKAVGNRCAVYGCGNDSSSKQFSFHTFPSDENLSRKWTKFVSTCRADFGKAYGTPNKYSTICHLHFERDCYPLTAHLMAGMGMKVKRHLIPGSVPTIQKPVTATATSSSTTTTSTSSSLVSSRPTTTTCATSTSTTITTTTTSSASDVTCTVYTGMIPICAPAVLPGVRNVRPAYTKREKKRTISEAELEFLTAEAPGVWEVSEEPNNSDKVVFDASCQTVVSTLPVSQCQVLEQVKKTKRSKRVQTRPRTSTKSVQCTIITTGTASSCPTTLPEPEPVAVCSQSSSSVPRDESDLSQGMMETDDEVDEAVDQARCDAKDKDYAPSACEETDTTDTEIDSPRKGGNVPPLSSASDCSLSVMRKFIVFEENLLELFDSCHSCGKHAHREISYMQGSLVVISQECGHCRARKFWKSQPFVKDTPAGNILMSAAILFSGSVPSKALRMLQHMGVAAISTDTFFLHQRTLLQPAVQDVWKYVQRQFFGKARAEGRVLTLGGDGRADSPGHSAKYGFYTLMDLDCMQICHVELVQSNEVGNSNRMEKEGLLRAVKHINNEGLEIKELVTDRHPQVIKFVRENMKNTKHSVDVWHVAKGLKKKLGKLSKERECEVLCEWIKSILNHLYWIPATCPTPQPKLMVEQWNSLANHLHNVHIHVGHELFTECRHGPLENPRKKKFLKEGTKVSVKLLDIIQSKQLLKDVGMLATGPQTAALEAFHAVLNHFCPKMLAFSFEGMVTRNLVAALHFNENANRKQAFDKAGNPRYGLVFKKAKNDFSVQDKREHQTFEYVDSLMAAVLRLAKNSSLNSINQALRLQGPRCPPPLCASFPRPDKAEAVANFRSRYKL